MTTHQVPTGDFVAMQAAINSNTKMLVSESPTNPHLTSVDLEKFVALDKACGVETLIDATLATPYNLRPIEFGVDFVLHSATKYLGRHNENGQRVAEFLNDHPRVERVYYPGLPSHPTHGIAASQMLGFGGLITFLIKDADWKETSRVVDAARIPRIAASLGGVESLIGQPMLMSYYHRTAEERRFFGIHDNMIRMSCGIENTDDLINDLQQALQGR